MAKGRVGCLFKRSKHSPRWYGAWTTPSGERKTKALFVDKAASLEALRKLVQESEREAAGLIDPSAKHRASPIAEHVAAYIAFSKLEGQAKRFVQVKELYLRRFTLDAGVQRLDQLSDDGVTAVLQTLQGQGLSARTLNAHVKTLKAFVSWCRRTKRLAVDPLGALPAFDEAADKRRERRPLNDAEFQRLLSVAGPRKPIYLVAGLTGLRKGELRQLRWGDIDLENALLKVRAEISKNGKDDFVPLHAQLLKPLRQLKPRDADAGTKVFAGMPSQYTFRRDLKKAHIARVDGLKRCVDFHCLRTSLGTNLARAGVAPQIAQRIMRHASMKTTLESYTKLELVDSARGIAALPIVAA